MTLGRLVLARGMVYHREHMDGMGWVWRRVSWLLGSLLLTGAVGCGDDAPDDSGMAGSSSNGGSSAGSSPTVTAGSGTSGSGTSGSGIGGATGGGDILAICMTVCARYDEACPDAGLDDCPDRCSMLEGRTPAGCSSLQSDYLSCLSERAPKCGGSGTWSEGYEEECDGKGRALCLKTMGAECIAGEDYDDVLCQTGNEGMYGYYCQKDVAPKAGCIVSTKTTRNGLHCCEQQLSL